MSEHSPTPWRIDVIDDCGIKIAAANEIDVLLLPAWILNAMDAVMLDEANAQHIVKCVNLHDGLVAELELWLPTILARRKWQFPEDDPVLSPQNHTRLPPVKTCLPLGHAKAHRKRIQYRRSRGG